MRVGVEMHGVGQWDAHGPRIVGHFAFGIVTQSGSVAHELPDSGRMPRWMYSPWAVDPLLLHPNAAELRQVMLDGLPEVDLSLVGQHHHRHAREIFRHRHDLEDRTGLHGFLVFHVTPTDGFHERHFSMA